MRSRALFGMSGWTIYEHTEQSREKERDYLLLDCHGLQLTIRRSSKTVCWRRNVLEEDVQVHGNALEAEHVIAVGGDLDLELRRFLHSIDDRALRVGCLPGASDKAEKNMGEI